MKANAYKPQRSPLQWEFESKNEILRSKFPEVSPEDYLSAIFPDRNEDNDFIVVLGTLKDKEGNILERGTTKRIKFGDVWKMACHSNIYIPYADFKNNYYRSETIRAVRAFVNDCDGVSSLNLKKVLKYLWASLPAEPTYIVNSGHGVHFVYALSKPQPVSGWRWSLNTLNKVIQAKVSKVLKVDKHPLVHPYRFPGFMTKINTTATVFRVRKPYTFEELMKLFEIGQKARKPVKGKKPKAKILVLPNGRRAFFEWVLRGLFRNPPIPGRRQNSFFALGIVSYKCRRYVPYDEAYEAVQMVYEDMMNRNLHVGFKLDEAYEAFHKGYNPRYIKASWEYLSELLGWEYRPNKRNGRKREEHLKIARQIKAVYLKARKKEKEEHIRRLLARGYNRSKIAEMLGISRRNLYETYGYLLND